MTLLVVLNRLPLLPSKDLLFLGAGVELARTLDVATAGVAGMLLVQSACTKLMNLAMLALAPPASDAAGSAPATEVSTGHGD